jgi:hypothetical protein
MEKQIFSKSFNKGGELLLISLIWFLIIPESVSQVLTDRVDLSFGIQTWDPVHIKVDEKTGSAFSTPIRFTALNSTYYPFNLSIDFVQFENLSPKPPVHDVKVSHGTNNLYTFSVQVPGVGYGYRYTYKYWLASSDEIINGEFPYLIPLKEGTLVKSKKTFFGSLINTFAGNAGDTVFCMRRGLVTAVPRSETMDFRLSQYDCLEVLHDDGTYMIYCYLKKTDNFTAPGRIVLPGQPIGTLSDSSYLFVKLMKIGEISNLLISQPIKYTLEKSRTVSFDEIDGIEKSVFPWEVITKEMKSKELKQAQKNK